MWKLLEQAAKTATANASEYAATVQSKAQSIVATVQDEAATLLHAIGTARTGPVDEILYEEIDDYKAFTETFQIDTHTDEISRILEEDDEIRDLHEQMVPVQLSYEEFWSRYYFRAHQEEERVRREEEKRKQHELELAAAKEKAHEADDDISIEGDNLSETEANEGNEEDEATLQQLREARANRKAAMQWKQKALEYKNQLALLADQHAAAQEDLKQRMESQYQSLCDNYETKMMEVTTQIDEARAAGYDAGIQESPRS
ncbi:hypothetical protein P43SY_005106 [Pythium insidiosum]|uniref:BSD domain-containing protein n=1 Tax=Pythium insidiosum TaxID=114742 RepID=A0AAD5Q4Y7_PYTIN|nr:hypothetical protein P43SY_005106 [Pythium insidiosum]